MDTTFQPPAPDHDHVHKESPLQGGQTVWVTALGDELVGIAWDWQEVRPGVLALADPMSILTNLELTQSGAALPRTDLMVALNTAVYRLRWQRVVSLAMREPEARTARSALLKAQHTRSRTLSARALHPC